jgi:hypothetical protein
MTQGDIMADKEVPAEGVKPEKLFTQEELNDVLKNRLTKEQRRFDAEIAQLSAENENLRNEQKAIKDKAQEQCKADIEALKAGADAAVLALIPEKLPLEDQRDWLRKALAEVPSQPVPRMPQTPTGKNVKTKEREPYPLPKAF